MMDYQRSRRLQYRISIRRTREWLVVEGKGNVNVGVNLDGLAKKHHW
jgi:hypothetical protein